MSLLNRDNLGSGRYRDGLRMPAELLWTEEQVARSLAEAWDARPAGAVWVFAYGSLMWNPLIAVAESRVAMLEGWRRSFCMRTVAGRGSPERPGRMLSLEPGGRAQGLALRLPDEQARHELGLLWQREMVAGSYRPLWLPLALEDGRTVQALAFTARPGHPMHEDDASVPTVARVMDGAVGVFGSNVDYVHALAGALSRHGLRDDYVDALLVALEAGGGPAEG